MGGVGVDDILRPSDIIGSIIESGEVVEVHAVIFENN
jgi:hypothetical protein